MNFADYAHLEIPEGQVKKITRKSDGLILWEESYINRVPRSIDTDGSIYNGKGYLDGYRLSSTGITKALARSTVTGYIPARPGDAIRIVGVDWYNNTANYLCAYDSSFNYIGAVYGAFKSYGTPPYDPAKCSVLNDHDALITLATDVINIAYIRVSSGGVTSTTTPGANMIVTVNEEVA